VTRSLPLLAVVVLTSAVSCAKTPPATPPVVALASPTPPARLIIPVELPEYVPPPPEPVVEPEPVPEPPRRPAASRAPEPAAARAPQPVDPGPVLQTTPAPPSAIEQRIVDLITAAEQRLMAVNARTLGPSQRDHWGQARDFIRMAYDALRIRNYQYAEQLATKANQVATLLTRG
jgi:outer membrane biosynthesis protein TonB